MSADKAGLVRLQALAAADDSDDVVGYWEFRARDIRKVARTLSVIHESVKGSAEDFMSLVVEPSKEEAMSDALERAAADAGLGILNSVPDLSDLVAAPQGPPDAFGTEVTEPTEEEHVEEIERRIEQRIRAEVSRTMFVEGMRSVRVNTGDKKEMCVEIIKGDGVQILEVAYLARGGVYRLGDAEIARLSIDGDLVGCIPAKRAATLWRAGEGASQVRLHGGPRGCVQKLSPGEVLEIRESDTERWLIRQIPIEFAHEPAQAHDLPAATIQDGPFWDESSATELTH